MGRRNQKTNECSSNDKQVMNSNDVGSHPGSPKPMQPLGSSSFVNESSNALDIATLRKRHLVRELELEEALMKAREEIEAMKLKYSDSCEQKGECRSVRQQSDGGNRFGYGANGVGVCGTQISDGGSTCRNQEYNYGQKPVNSSHPIMSGPVTSLPRVELSCFDGSLTEYWTFMKQFEYYVEAQTGDPGQRLLQLLHYCKGRAHEAIKECVMLPPVVAYDRARRILRDLFGQPSHIARSMIEGLLNDAKRVSNSAEALSRLAIKMQNCSIALSQMNYEADLNALHTLEMIVKWLPSNLQTRWAEQADDIGMTGREPSFVELTEFIAKHSRIARSRFGQLTDRTQASSSVSRPCEHNRTHAGRQEARAMALTTSSTSKVESFGCRLCGARHRLSCCPEFSNLSVSERWNAAKRLGVCFSCLGASHRVSACANNAFCQEAGCRARHHRLLHRTVEENEVKPNPVTSCNVINSTKKIVRLGVVPLKVDTPRGVVETLAFLDSGSDTTLVRGSFLKKFGFHGEPSALTISTIGGTRETRCSRVTLKLMSLDGEEVVTVDEAFSISDLPIMPVNSIRKEAERWPHLRDIDFPDVQGKEVSMLIGCDVPEAHWVLDQKISGRKRPFAVRSLLGWILCGPITDGTKDHASVNYISGTLSLAEQPKFKYDRGFCDTVQPGNAMSVKDRVAQTLLSSRQRIADGHFEVPLPWKSNHSALVNNRLLAEKSLGYLGRRILRDQNVHEEHKSIFQHPPGRRLFEQLKKGSTEPGQDQAWYLPYYPAFNPKELEKVTAVFDNEANFQGLFLDNRLLQEPDIGLLRGKTIKCISLFESSVEKEKFVNDVGHVMKLLVEIQTQNDTDAAGGNDDPQTSCMIRAWSRICKLLGRDFENRLPSPVLQILRFASMKSEFCILDNSETATVKSDIDLQVVKFGENRKYAIRSRGMKDTETTCQMLVCYAREKKGGLSPDCQWVFDIIVFLLYFDFNDEVRSAAAECSLRLVTERDKGECVLLGICDVVHVAFVAFSEEALTIFQKLVEFDVKLPELQWNISVWDNVICPSDNCDSDDRPKSSTAFGNNLRSITQQNGFPGDKILSAYEICVFILRHMQSSSSIVETWPTSGIPNKQREGVELKRGNVWLIRFKRFWKLMKPRRCKVPLSLGSRGFDKLQKAEVDVLRLGQLESFPVELQHISSPTSVRKGVGSMCAGRSFRVGEVVLVVADSLRGETWPVGIMRKCYINSGGLVRAIGVKVVNGIVHQDIHRIFMLERASNEGPIKSSGQSVQGDDQMIGNGQYEVVGGRVRYLLPSGVA